MQKNIKKSNIFRKIKLAASLDVIAPMLAYEKVVYTLVLPPCVSPVCLPYLQAATEARVVAN